MADNVTLNPGSGGAVVATDQLPDSSQAQRVKIVLGVDGADGGNVSSSNALPVSGPLTDAQLRASAVPVSASALPLPTGASTETTLAAVNTAIGAKADAQASDDTGTWSAIALIKRLLGKIPGLGQAAMAASLPVALASNQTALPITDNAGSLTVDGTVTANLAAGTNNIGDVDVLSVPAPLSTTGGGTEATALRVTLASNSTGVVAVTDNAGSLTVDGTVAVSGTVATSSTEIASIIKDEDAAHTTGDKGVMLLAVRNDAGTVLAGTTGDYIPLHTNSSGNLRVNALGAVAEDSALAGNPIAVGVKANSTAPADMSANGDTVIPWALLNGSLVVNLAAGGTLVPLGQATMAASLPVVLASNQSAITVGGAAAQDAPISGSPVPNGLRSAVPGTPPTDMSAAGDVVYQRGTLSGATVVSPGQLLKSITGSASATFTAVAAVASKKIKVYSLSLMTSSTTAVTVTFKDGAAGTAKATYLLQAITGTNFGITENLGDQMTLFEGTVNTLLEMSFSAAVNVTYNLRYFEEA